jgi:hypothetical protein
MKDEEVKFEEIESSLTLVEQEDDTVALLSYALKYISSRLSGELRDVVYFGSKKVVYFLFIMNRQSES